MSKDLHFDLVARCEMPYNVYKQIKDEEQFEELRLLNVKDKSINYKEDKRWIKANDTLKEAVIKRKEIEEQIRVEKHLQ